MVENPPGIKFCNLCHDVGLECHEYPFKSRVIKFKGAYAGVRLNSPIINCRTRIEIIKEQKERWFFERKKAIK